MMMDNALYFVVDEATRPRYLAHGSACFSYENGTRRVEVRRYQEVPTQVLENADFLVAWGREAVASAAGGKRNSRRRKREA